MSWVPTPVRGSGVLSRIPDNFQLCDGSLINEGPWQGLYTPNMTDVFLRGGTTLNYLEYQDDSIQDHVHIDLGHTHDDPGHTHQDAGHSHGYVDRWLHQEGSTDDFDDSDDYDNGYIYENKQTASAKANIQTAFTNLRSSYANIQGVNGNSAKISDETRPKNMKVCFIMRIK